MPLSKFIAGVVLWSAAFLATGAQPDLGNPEAFSRWITFYYTAPQPGLVGKAYLAASKSGLLKGESTTPPMFGFLAGIVAKNRDSAHSLAKELSALPENEQQIVVLGYWYSGHPETRALLTALSTAMPRIMAALPWAEIRGDIPRLIVGGSARWSLRSNAVQHPRVLAICREQLPSQAPDVAEALRKVIALAEEDLRKVRAPGSN